ncbi:hypothetical protein NCZ17_01480 [Acinetobacter modestus]|uniref:hypothetical protein n=1 Tax=Acinetobacter modestus TaxID=1776740 RepID=UPI00202F9181|nr:hypothetical protein [Acinetobacter modestus]MCM1958044.1 hypothetical protein [Acinetobacter modestus]
MSNRYRDDIHEIIAYSNSTFGQQASVTDEVMHVTDNVKSKVTVHSADEVVAADEIVDRRIQALNDQIALVDTFIGRKRHIDHIFEKIIVVDRFKARLHAKTFIDDVIDTANSHREHYTGTTKDMLVVSENIVGHKHSVSRITDRIKVSDQFNRSRYRDNVTDVLVVTDVFSRHKIRSFMHERIAHLDTWRSTRHTQSKVYERIGIKDKGIGRFSQQVIDHVSFSERYQQRLFAVQYVVDVLNPTEEFKQLRRVKQWIYENLVIVEQPAGKCYAKQLINELLFLDDDVLGERHRGFAWTANADTWAMSRYDSYQFNDMVVIDGVLYGINDSGVFRVNAESEVDAKIVTGQLDVGKGQLVHPIAAYLEYQLSGNSKKLEVGVSTTQGGTKQTYYYPLPNERADYLTNGRVLFGRGLRGRHFSFEFKISGQSGYINDLNIDVTPTKRRI